MKKLVRIYKLYSGYHIGIPKKWRDMLELEKEEYLELTFDGEKIIVEKIKKIEKNT